MRTVASFLPGAALIVFNLGWDMIGYRNPTLGIVLWIVSVLLLAIPGAYWVHVTRKERNQTKSERRSEVSDQRDTGESEESGKIVDNRSVTSHGQMGGQTAFNITNEGPQPRKITHAAGGELVRVLQNHSPEQFQISWMQDAESSELGAVLQNLLEQGGWQMNMQVSGAMLSGGPPRGVIVETTIDSGAVRAFVEWLPGAGLNPHVNAGLNPHVNTDQHRFGILTMEPVPVHVVVGVLPA